jgi:4-hydroxy-3-polyprenylbenzoate decarboxylase
MGYRSLRQCVDDLKKHDHLIVVDEEVDANLEIAEIHRRVYHNGGPAIYFSNVKNCQFPMVSNLFGTLDRARFMFRDSIENVRRAIELKIDPSQFARKPMRYMSAPLTAWRMRPKKVSRGSVLKNTTSISKLPMLKSWPDDGGAFVTLPQVYTEDVNQPGVSHSNLGMYRVQLNGNKYKTDKQIGLHYQIHRGIGVHHHSARHAKKPFRVAIFVGGTPAMTLSAVMPLPEGMSELTFAGALAGHRIRMADFGWHLPVYADADFAILGTVDPDQLLPEGPFGDHLGYYSLAHEFPVLNIEHVFHRDDAIWPFTVVGRPPQEDTTFGQLIHELTGPIIPTVIPGVKAVHAVDAAGVHPLLLAIGSERYDVYRAVKHPQELLTQANAILGQGQMSLAKYLWIIDQAVDPSLDIHNEESFLKRALERVDWKRDLHFQTKTTIDTLDYSGSGLNAGSKVVIAAAGPKQRELGIFLPEDLQLPEGFGAPKICFPGVIAVQAEAGKQAVAVEQLCRQLAGVKLVGSFPLIVVVDDSQFTSANMRNFLWVVFTRSNPAVDIYGVDAFVEHKHWGCRGSLIIDARIKPHHAPPLIEDPKVSGKIDAMATRNLPVSKYL